MLDGILLGSLIPEAHIPEFKMEPIAQYTDVQTILFLLYLQIHEGSQIVHHIGGKLELSEVIIKVGQRLGKGTAQSKIKGEITDAHTLLHDLGNQYVIHHR